MTMREVVGLQLARHVGESTSGVLAYFLFN